MHSASRFGLLLSFSCKFCNPSIPGASQLFLLSMWNSFITGTFAWSNPFASSIQGIFSVLLFFSQIPAQNLTNFSIRPCSFSGLISFQCFAKAFLVMLDLDFILLSLSLFNTFSQLSCISVYQSIAPLPFTNCCRLVLSPFSLSIVSRFLFLSSLFFSLLSF